MFIAALFIKVKTWKQCKCPLTDEWVKNMWYIYIQRTYKYTLSHKKMKIMPFSWHWMNMDKPRDYTK